MPSKAEVRDKVLTEISKASGTPKTKLEDGDKLQKDLGIGSEQFAILAQNLREFIKETNPDETLLVKEIKTASSTVGGVIDLVYKRANP